MRNLVGSIYHENHLRCHTENGQAQRIRIWCAEVKINGKKYRKKSMKRENCERWLQEVRAYLLGAVPFPGRKYHPGETPPKKKHKKRKIQTTE